MPFNFTPPVIDIQQTKAFGSCLISSSERVLILDVFRAFILFVEKYNMCVNQDVAMTADLCDRVSELGVRLQWEGTSADEVH